MTEHENHIRKEIEATIDRAGFESLDPEALDVTVTDAFRRKLGDCVVRFRESKSEFPTECEIRIAHRLFDEEHGEQWRDTVRHEVAHAYVYTSVGRDVDPHGDEWKEAARRAGADPTARYEGGEIVDAEYVLTCPNDCFERGYVKRSKRIKQPWRYICDECDEKLISYDHGERPTDLEAGRCHVASIPWQEPRVVHACPNDCFSVGYGEHCEETRQPERYSCENCGARTVSYRAEDR